MEHDPSKPRSARFDEFDRLLAARGHDLGFAGIRVAAGGSGIVVGFSKDAMLHVSWWVVSALVLLFGARRLRRD